MYSSSQPPSISRLSRKAQNGAVVPNEIILKIFDAISDSKSLTVREKRLIFANLTRVCCYFHAMSLPRLYSSLNFIKPTKGLAVLCKKILTDDTAAVSLVKTVTFHGWLDYYDDLDVGWVYTDFGSFLSLSQQSIVRLANLTTLSLHSISVDNIFLRVIAGLQNLTSLDIVDCPFLEPEDPQDLEPFLPILKRFVFHSYEYTERSPLFIRLAAVVSSTSLQSLDIYDSHVMEDIMTQPVNFCLEELDVIVNRFQPVCDFILKVPSIMKLSIFYGDGLIALPDAPLPLSVLPNLMHLRLPASLPVFPQHLLKRSTAPLGTGNCDTLSLQFKIQTTPVRFQHVYQTILAETFLSKYLVTDMDVGFDCEFYDNKELLYREHGLLGCGPFVGFATLVRDVATEEESVVLKIQQLSGYCKSESSFFSAVKEKVKTSGDKAWILDHISRFIYDMDCNKTSELAQQRLSEFVQHEAHEPAALHIIVSESLHPITSITDWVELACIFRDVLKALKWAYEEIEIVHRNISHITIMCRKVGNQVKGVLDGFSLAAPRGSAPCVTSRNWARMKPFTAGELLRNSPQVDVHYYRFDLESLFWVMIWQGSRYENGALVEAAPYTEWETAEPQRVYHLRNDSFNYSQNSRPLEFTPQFAPLEDLANDLLYALMTGKVNHLMAMQTRDDIAHRAALLHEAASEISAYRRRKLMKRLDTFDAQVLEPYECDIETLGGAISFSIFEEIFETYIGEESDEESSL